MLNLVDTNDILEVTTSAAVTVDVVCSFVDLSGSTTTPGKQLTAISTATTTTIVSAPGASTYRNIKTVNIHNKHATSAVDVTVILDDNGTNYQMTKRTLRAGETLQYIEGIGWFLDTVANQVTTKLLGSDQSNSTTTPTEVTGLTVTTGLGTFKYQYLVRYQAAATTTGVRFSVNHTGTVSFFMGWWFGVDNTATASTGAMDQDAVGAAMQVFSVNAARAKSTAGWGTSISVDTATSDMMAFVEGMFECTVDGNLALWHGSEVAAASTVKAGTSLILTKVV